MIASTAPRLDVHPWRNGAVVGLRIVASRRPQSRRYSPISALPVSLRYSILAAQNITAPVESTI